MNSTTATQTDAMQSFAAFVRSEGAKLNGKVAIGANSKYAHIMNGYTSHMLVKTACGHRINAFVMSADEAAQNGHPMCGACTVAVTPVVKKVATPCEDCGNNNISKTSTFCSVCRPYHAHSFVKPSAKLRRDIMNLGRSEEEAKNACNSCGLDVSDKLHG